MKEDMKNALDWLNEIISNPEGWQMFYSDSETKICAEAALSLLKEQEAIEPIAIKQEMFDDEFYGAVSHCPKCDCMWIMEMENDIHYCPKCGQAVK